MKKIIAGVLALMLLTGCAASDNNEELTAVTMETAETTTETEEMTVQESETEKSESETISETSDEYEKPIFASEEAENYYNIIMSDTSWKKDDAIGANIIDLHGDGTPEFIVERFNMIRECYRFGEEKLELLYSFEWDSVLSKCVEDGKTYWWGNVESFEEFGESNGRMNSFKSEESYGLMEFTENGPEMVKVIFFSTEEYDAETDIRKGEMFINGEKYADDYVENYTNLDGVPPMNYFGWKVEKEKWENENFAARYLLHPNEEWWKEDTDVSEDICKLVNAYCENDLDYLAISVHGDAAVENINS